MCLFICKGEEEEEEEEEEEGGGGGCTYGAAFVSRRILRFLRSWASGRICRCFSRDSCRSIGERGVSSTTTEEELVFGSVMVFFG